MAQNAPGKHYRKGVTLAQLIKQFPTDEAAEQWFIDTRWPDGVRCPKCDSDNVQRAENPQAPALPVPVLPQGFLGQNRDPDARLKTWGSRPGRWRST